MTWIPQDYRRHTGETPSQDNAFTPAETESASFSALAANATGPPLSELVMSWGDAEDGADPPVSMETERDLRDQGFLSEAMWRNMARLMRRGTQEI